MERSELRTIVEAIYVLEDIHKRRLSSNDEYDMSELSAQFPQYDMETLKEIVRDYNYIWREFNHKCFEWSMDEDQTGIECPYHLSTNDIVYELYRIINK